MCCYHIFIKAGLHNDLSCSVFNYNHLKDVVYSTALRCKCEVIIFLVFIFESVSVVSQMYLWLPIVGHFTPNTVSSSNFYWTSPVADLHAKNSLKYKTLHLQYILKRQMNGQVYNQLPGEVPNNGNTSVHLMDSQTMHLQIMDSQIMHLQIMNIPAKHQLLCKNNH